MPETTNPPTKLLAKLNKIMGEVGYIQQDKRNVFQNYNYLSDRAIKERVQEAFLKHGVIAIPTQQKVTRERFLTTPAKADGKEKHQWYVSTELLFTIWDCESGECIENIPCAGDGCDSMDKGVYKAITGAVKYLWRNLFQIPTGDDPEADEHTKEAQKAVAQRKLKELTKKTAGSADTLDIKKMVQSITSLKAQLTVLESEPGTGETTYYRVLLAVGGVKHANDPKLMKNGGRLGKEVYKELLAEVNKAKALASATPSPEVSGPNGQTPTEHLPSESDLIARYQKAAKEPDANKRQLEIQRVLEEADRAGVPQARLIFSI